MQNLVVGEAAASSAATSPARSFSAQTITVGPEPESVAPSIPAGGSSRTAARCGACAARYGSCSRSPALAAKSRALPDASAAPSSVARIALKTASVCSIACGNDERASAVFKRSCGTSAIAAAGTSSAMRAIVPSQVRQTPPTSAAARLSACPSNSSPSASSSSAVGSFPAASAPATSPSATTAALDPSPRSRGIRSTKLNDHSFGDA